jgi:O-antigen/teichoic acid export membrane protein
MKDLIIRYVKNPMLQKMLVYSFSDGISQAMPFLVLPILANYLTTEDFGIATNYNVLVQMVTAFITLSAPTLLSVNFFRVEKEKRAVLISNLVYLNGVAFLVMLLVVLIFYPFIKSALFIDLKWQLLALVLVLFASINNLQLTKLRLEENVRAYGAQQFMKSASAASLSLLFVIGLAWHWEGRLAALVLSGILVGAYSTYLLFRDKALFSAFNFAEIKTYFNFSYPLLPKQLSTWLSSAFQKIFITTQISLAANGLLSFAITIASIFYLFITSFFSAYTPQLFKTLAENENNENTDYKLKLVKTTYLFLVVFAVLLFIGYFTVRIFLNNFFNPAYRNAVQFLPYLLVSQFLQAIYLLLTSYITFYKKTKIIGALTTVMTLITVLLNYWMISRYDTMGAVYATLTMAILTVFPLYYFSNKICPMPWFSKEIFNTK